MGHRQVARQMARKVECCAFWGSDGDTADGDDVIGVDSLVAHLDAVGGRPHCQIISMGVVASTQSAP